MGIEGIFNLCATCLGMHKDVEITALQIHCKMEFDVEVSPNRAKVFSYFVCQAIHFIPFETSYKCSWRQRS
jgi:hypothetical protein